MSYTERIFEKVIKENPNEPEFHQAVIETLRPAAKVIDGNKLYEELAILERITEADRQIKFRVSWRDDKGSVRVNKGYRVQFNNALGPYKGGLRFHPSVNIGVIKFLGFEQIFKNALTGMPIGGAKGGSDFDPKGKSDFEVMSFCQSFITELFRHIGAQTDVPAGDIGVGAREIGFLYGQYKRLKNVHEGVLTGKGLELDGLPGRKEATGYGLVYFTEEMLLANGKNFSNKRVSISGAGNVAIYAAEKSIDMGASVVTMSDSNGWIYAPKGIDLSIIKDIKEVKNLRIHEYVKFDAQAKYFQGRFDWSVPCDIAMPCATQNEILLNDAKNLIKNQCFAIAEGANMPTDLASIKLFLENGTLFAPAKAANAGGVSASALEMSQNSMKMKWEFAYVEETLKGIMKRIFAKIAATSEEFGEPKNYVMGANIHSFRNVSESMISQGVI
ncbi:MAG: NADP-specific glutamate dehydrogenase [Oscillospiraceae bacterium]|jgi:glutamate dehydrogenase (NADP+)|nr:NADP-specific glutamate dehydrogenase [Oscillospiraceae bacterium]